MQRAHVVQTVGEFHQQDAHVFGHGDHELAKVLRLFAGVAAQFDLRQLGDAVHEIGDFLAEKGPYVVNAGVRVFNDVMQQGRRHRRRIGAQLREDGRNRQGVGKIRIARSSRLAAMGFHGVYISPVQKIFIRVGIIRFNPVDELDLTDKAYRLARLLRRR